MIFQGFSWAILIITNEGRRSFQLADQKNQKSHSSFYSSLFPYSSLPSFLLPSLFPYSSLPSFLLPSLFPYSSLPSFLLPSLFPYSSLPSFLLPSLFPFNLPSLPFSFHPFLPEIVLNFHCHDCHDINIPCTDSSLPLLKSVSWLIPAFVDVCRELATTHRVKGDFIQWANNMMRHNRHLFKETLPLHKGPLSKTPYQEGPSHRMLLPKVPLSKTPYQEEPSHRQPLSRMLHCSMHLSNFRLNSSHRAQRPGRHKRSKDKVCKCIGSTHIELCWNPWLWKILDGPGNTPVLKVHSLRGYFFPHL